MLPALPIGAARCLQQSHACSIAGCLQRTLVHCTRVCLAGTCCPWRRPSLHGFQQQPRTRRSSVLQAAEGKAYSGYDYAKDTTASSYDSALHSAYDSWQVGTRLHSQPLLLPPGLLAALH